jgi:crotonobetainyl-CoA:carnitine CoA-transferase CaiB-like acyl-CoA transferase
MPGAPPLDGIRVLEVGNFMAGPFCAMQLADLGADVVKIENPAGGDNVRLTAPFLDGESSNFIRLNRNKRSLALDLKLPEGAAIFRRLADRADVVVENLRPGTMARLGLDYPRLRESNPGLVYVAASGWGQAGPYSKLAGLDIMAQAMSGLMSITGEPGGGPVKVGVPVCDLVCALYGALAAVSALRARERDGEGQFIDVSLFEAGVSLAVWEAGRYFATGEVPGPLGSAHQSTAPYQAFRAADGHFTAGVPSPVLWTAFLRVLGLEELEGDPRFATNADRHANRDELAGLIEEVTAERDRAHWIAAFQAAGVPCGAIQTYDQVFADPQLTAREFFWDAPHPTLGEVRQLGSPMRLGATPTRRDGAGPRLGQHSAEVLAELGYGPAEYEELRDRAVTA